MDKVVKQCLDLILSADRDGANDLIDGWIEENGSRQVIEKIMAPIMVELGELWNKQKDISFAQVYVSATIAEDIILKALVKAENIEAGSRGAVIIGNIEDDFHSLGRRIITTFLTSKGWKVIDLGNDVTAEEFVDGAIEAGAKYVMVSAMMYTTAVNIRSVREEIDNRGYKDKIKLVVGGAIFNLREELWKEVGADFTSKNAIDVVELLDELDKQVI